MTSSYRGDPVSASPGRAEKMIVTISGADSSLSMSGTWSTNRTRFYLAATGSVQMKKEKDFRQSDLFKKLDSLSMTAKLSYSRPATPAPVSQPVVARKKLLSRRLTDTLSKNNQGNVPVRKRQKSAQGASPIHPQGTCHQTQNPVLRS